MNDAYARACRLYHGLLDRAARNRSLSDDSPAWQKIDAQACDMAWLAVYGIDGNFGQRYRAEASAAQMTDDLSSARNYLQRVNHPH